MNSNSWKFSPHIFFLFKMAWSLITKCSRPDQSFSIKIFTLAFHVPQIWNICSCTTRSYSFILFINFLRVSAGNLHWRYPSINRSTSDVMNVDTWLFVKILSAVWPSSLKCQHPQKLYSWILQLINLIKGLCTNYRPEFAFRKSHVLTKLIKSLTECIYQRVSPI